MSEPTDAEKMRLKRLARLGGTSTPVPPAESSTPTPSASTTPAPKPNPSPAPTPKAGPSTSVSTSSPALASRKRPASPPKSTPTPTPAPRAVVRPTIPYEQWERNKICAVFSVTLSRAEAEQSNWTLCWLKEAESDLAGAPISPEVADTLLIARLQLSPDTSDPELLPVIAGLPLDETAFEYLIGCWRRLYAANRELNRSGYDKTQWPATFDRLKGLIISYCGMTLEDPSMFPQPSNKPLGPAEFLPLLLIATPGAGDPLTTGGAAAPTIASLLPPDDLLPFLNDLAQGVSTEQLADTITPTLSLFFQEWFKLNSPDLLGDEWRRYLGAMHTLTQVKPIAALLPTLGIWVAPNVDAPKLEWQSLLGPLTRLSVYPREFAQIWKTYFSNPTDRKVADIDANKSNLRHTLGALHDSLFNIYNAIVRSSPDAREGVLAFFALVVRLNERRAGMRVDHRVVSSDGFMTNLQVVLLKLFEPVMDASFSKIDKVDPEYYRRSSRINIADETKVKATKEEADAFYAASPAPANFISDLFFLLNAFQHLGVVKTIGNRIRAEKSIGELEKELKHHEAELGGSQPPMTAQIEAAIAKYKGDLATLHASIHAYDTQLLDPKLVRANVSYLGFLMTWLMRLVSPGYPQTPLQLPLPAAPEVFRMLPEYLFDNIAEYLDFLARYNPDALDNADKDVLISFVITFLTPDYVNNPFLKAKLVSIIANGLYPVGYWRKGTLFDRLSVHSLSTVHLMPTLIRFWIDVEATGGHTQFWDKFTFRRDISRIFKSMWGNSLHREAFVKTRHDDFDQFVRFVNMLMNDTTFHLDESLGGLAKINQLKSQIEDAGFSALPQAEQDDATSQLRQTENSAPFHTQMGLDHIELIRDLTATTREPFVTAEIVDRLTASLDMNLATLVGPKMQDLKLADPERFHFKPKRLLAAIAQVYLNLGEEAAFIRAVAEDGRSYTRELFERFARVLKHRAIMTEGEVAEVVAFTQRVEDMKATIAIEEEREVPDEFCDPLLGTVMRDPVILPRSGMRIDRATIRTSLLSKEVDPFNNQTLKIEECLPDAELKARIEAWKAEANVRPADVMDVDEL